MILSTVLPLMSVMLSMIIVAVHRIEEGHVGIYFRAGALLPTTSEPGMNLLAPLLTSYRSIQVTIRKDVLTNVPCRTSGGVIIYFDRIEVISKLTADCVLDIVRNYTADYNHVLIFDKIHQELNHLCSSYTVHEVYITHFDRIDENLKAALQADLKEMAPGLNILNVEVRKPIIPQGIAKIYELMEVEKTRLLISVEIKLKKAIIETENHALVSQIKYKNLIKKQQWMQRLEQIENQMQSDRSRSQADSELYTTQQMSIANQMLLTPEYLELKKYEAITMNNKIYFGKNIPNMFVDNGFVGAVLDEDEDTSVVMERTKNQ